MSNWQDAWRPREPCSQYTFSKMRRFIVVDGELVEVEEDFPDPPATQSMVVTAIDVERGTITVGRVTP